MDVFSKNKMWMYVPAVGVVLWKTLRTRSQRLTQTSMEAMEVDSGRVERGPRDPPSTSNRGPATDGPVETQPLAFNWNGLPELVLSQILDHVRTGADGNVDLSHLRATCRAVRDLVNLNLRTLQGSRILAAGATFSELAKFENISSLKLDLRQSNLTEVVDVLENLNSISELSLKGVNDRDALLSNCLSRKTTLKRLELKASLLPDLRFISNLTNLTSLSLVDIKAQNSTFDSWENMSNLEELKIDKSDFIARDNLTSLSAIPHLRSLYLGVRNYRKTDLLTLVDLEARLSMCLYGLKDPNKLSAIKDLPTLKSLSLISCDLSRFPFPLASLESLERLKILTDALFPDDVENLLGVRDQLESLEVELMSTNMLVVKDLCRAGLPLRTLKVNTDIFEPEDSLNNCVGLKSLYISATREVSRDVFHSLSPLAHLEHLTLRECLFSTEGLANLCVSCPALKSLTIGACVLADSEFAHIGRIATLQKLELLCCLSLRDLSSLNDLQELKTLKIENCLQVENNLTTVLNEPFMTRLETLDITFSPQFDFAGCASLFEELKNRSPCLILKTRGGIL